MRQEMETQIKELLQNGLREPSTSEWRSPVVILKKPGDAEYRFAIDYRKVNGVSERTSFPLPRFDDAWDSIGEAKASYFTVLDLARARLSRGNVSTNGTDYHFGYQMQQRHFR